MSLAMEVDVSAEDASKQYINDINQGQIELFKVVENLGPKLTHKSPSERAEGVQILTNIVSGLENAFLTEVQLEFISTFYADRLKDHHDVIPSVLDGILALSRMKNLPNDAPSKLLKAMFVNVACQQQTRTDRHKIYSIIQSFAANKTEDTRKMGVDLTIGLMYAMDGERDPRNLLYLFSILPSILKILQLGHVSEEMFEVMACYFPVDFNTPQDEAKSITRADLADRLSLCLCAVPAFDNYCIQLLLEKLESDLRVAKLDSLKLLKQSCSTFKPESYESHIHNIWECLQKEILLDADPEIKQHSHEALLDLVGNLSSSDSQIADSFLKMTTTTIRCALVDAKLKTRIESLLHVLLTISNASEKSCLYVVKLVQPKIVEQFNSADFVFQQVTLGYFTAVFTICKRWDIVRQVSDDFRPIVQLSIDAAKSSGENLKLIGLKSIAEMSDIVTVNDAVICQDLIVDDLNLERSKLVIEAVKTCLLSLIKRYPETFENSITEFCTLDSLSDNRVLLSRKIDVLCTILTVDYYTKTVTNCFYKYIAGDKNIAAFVLAALSDTLRNKEIYADEKLRTIECDLNVISTLFDSVDGYSNNRAVLQNICSIIDSIVKAQTGDVQIDLYARFLSRCLERIEDRQIWNVVLIEALLNSSRTTVRFDRLDQIVEYAYEAAIEQCDEFIQRRSCRLIANVLNKYISNEDTKCIYDKLKIELTKRIDGDELDGIAYSNSIALISWITKSFLLNGHPDASDWILKLVGLLRSEKWGSNAADGFDLIMSDDNYSLNRNSYCKYNFLYKQKVFQMFLHYIDVQEFDNNNSAAFYQACTYIIQSIPKSVLLMELEKISPIIIDCLNFEASTILLPILEVLSYLIRNRKSTFQLQTLLPRCLRLCGFSNVRVRAESLQCMFEIANNYTTPQLLPYKQDIILELAKQLDDPKRLVRSVAVKARTRWYLIGSPGEDK